MNLSAPFVHRPVATLLLALALMGAGALALQFLPVAPLPRVDMPTIMVQAQLPGASPETMASAIAMPLERRFGRIAGISEITSTSSLGSCNLNLQFALDRDVEAAARDVQAAIQAASGDLPANLPSRPSFHKINPADAPILVVALTSPTLSPAALYDVANTVLAQRLAQVDGVGQVMVGGGGQPAVRVAADPERLAARGLTLSDLRAALAAWNVNLPKGGVQDDVHARSLQINDQLEGAEAARRTIVAYRGGGAIAVGDVADVRDDVENNRSAAWFDGQRAVLLIVRRQPGANIIETVAEVKAALPNLVAAISPAIDLHVGLDRSATIEAAVHDVSFTLVLSVLLVVGVVLVFLRDVRATLVPSLAVPLSLLGTFAAMWLLDYSLDNLSLMALTISTGFVVDDAIVVTENVMRHLERGRPAKEAALRGTAEVGFTVVSMTASLVAVFLPLLLLQGVVGRLFFEFAAVLSLSVVISAVVSLTVTPMLCAQLLKPAAQAGAAQAGGAAGTEQGHGHAHGALERAYAHSLQFVLRHRRWTMLATLATVAVTVQLFAALPKGLFPQQDTGMLMGMSEGAQDASFAAMRDKQFAAGQLIKADPAVDHVVSFVGGGGPGGAGNTGTFFVSLRPKDARDVSADGVVARLRPRLAQMVGYNVFLQAAQDVRVGGRSARTQYQYTLQDVQLSRLRQWAPKLTRALQKLPQLRDVASDQQTAGLSYNLSVDRDAAAYYGTSLQNVDDALYDAFGQRLVATRYTLDNTYRTVLEATPGAQADPAGVQRVYVPGSQGAVPLQAVSRAEMGTTPLAVNHQGQFPAITLSFNLAPGVALGEAVAAIDQAKRDIHLPAQLRADFQGTAQAFRETTEGLPLLLVAALVAVYIVLGILYESFVHPLTILSTLPPAGVGALLALQLCGLELSIIAFIGLILLIGIVKKNAIMVVDFAIDAQRRGAMAAEAAITQACLLRLRPILMTTLAALLAGLPLAFGNGTGAELRRPLGIAIVGGLTLSQLLTLYTTPVIYLALERLRRSPSKA